MANGAEASPERCEACRFFHKRQGRWSVCRRFPPTPGAKGAKDGFPVVSADDWCGEFDDKA